MSLNRILTVLVSVTEIVFVLQEMPEESRDNPIHLSTTIHKSPDLLSQFSYYATGRLLSKFKFNLSNQLSKIQWKSCEVAPVSLIYIFRILFSVREFFFKTCEITAATFVYYLKSWNVRQLQVRSRAICLHLSLKCFQKRLPGNSTIFFKNAKYKKLTLNYLVKKIHFVYL